MNQLEDGPAIPLNLLVQDVQLLGRRILLQQLARHLSLRC